MPRHSHAILPYFAPIFVAFATALPPLLSLDTQRYCQLSPAADAERDARQPAIDTPLLMPLFRHLSFHVFADFATMPIAYRR
jgi:membrane glycosyltransferase